MSEEQEEKNGSIHFMTLFNRQGKTRLAKWCRPAARPRRMPRRGSGLTPASACAAGRYKPFSTKAKTRMLREMNNLILSRRTAMCNVLEWKGMKLVYKRCGPHPPPARLPSIVPRPARRRAAARYASLYFVACIDMNFNELITLEIIHMFVETLDRYFGNVCELDIMCAPAPPNPAGRSTPDSRARGADSTFIKHTICSTSW
eukprot:COSAG04_NODE_732_length_10723_cov_5.273155_6_plen_202_part_00